MDTIVAEHLERVRAALAGRYAIERELGRGGMACVYLARDLHHDRAVAVKVLRPELHASLAAERFLREIRIEARLQHPHILPVHDSGAVGGILYCVMPYVTGETLRDRLARERQLPVDEALRIAREVADALAYAHAQGVVHRDIKPGNILLSDNHAVVSDFGIARAITAAAAHGEQLTDSGVAVGTPDYMSPEQASGDAMVDGRTDLYALGCVLYEMLAGEPPFHGRTVQAVLARHRSEPPPSLRVVRPTVPVTVETVITTALAKVPADRFASAGALMRSLDSATSLTALPAAAGHPARRVPRRAVLGLVAAAAILALALLLTRRGPPLDPNRVVVFPLRETGLGPQDAGAGENVATIIGYALEGTQPLAWLDGWDYLDQRQRGSAGQVIPAAARGISRAQRARYYIDGSIAGGRDSARVVLRLHDVTGDSVVARAGAAGGPGASLPQLGLRAVSDLLPSLLAPGRRVDISALSQRRPSAVAKFLQGEREYRRMHFGRALEYYRAAMSEDSALALAALKGAQAANWLHVAGEDLASVEAALRRQALLPPRQALFARGLRDYFTGAADSAVRRLTLATAQDSSWSEAWMALGEVYYHLLPDTLPLDSLAESAFERSQHADSSFTPPLLHLAEIAIRRGETGRAATLMARVHLEEADSALRNPVSLMLQCVRGSPDTVSWDELARQRPLDVLAAGKLLAVGAAQPPCAEAALTAVLRDSAGGPGERWAALVGLDALFLAQGRDPEVRRLLGSVAGLPAGRLHLLNAAATGRFSAEAAGQAEQLGTDYPRLDPPMLWLLGIWAGRRGDATALRSIVSALTAKRDSSASTRDSLLVQVLAARLPLVAGDTAGALQALRALRPSAPASDLEWQLWESLGEERVLLAELLLARGQPAEALRVAARLDSPQPLPYLLYLRRSLVVRTRAASALGRTGLAVVYGRRLQSLDVH